MADSAGPGLGESSSPPAPAKPPTPRRDGPTDGIAPLCGVAAVATEYAAGETRQASTATAATQTRGRRNRPATSSNTAAATPPTATGARSHGSHSASRDNSTAARMVVERTAPGLGVAARMSERLRHNSVAPMPIDAPTAGASATV